MVGQVHDPTLDPGHALLNPCRGSNYTGAPM
jgi:hypothetical protein